MKPIMTFSIFAISLLMMMCSTSEQNQSKEIALEPTSIANVQLDTLSTAYFASGCFWCVEAIFESVKGVEEAISGYAGGKEQNPTYQQVGAGRTGHTETVKVYYNPNVVSYEMLITVYYGSHDPTTVNGQHPDYGSQYRSIIFYQNDSEKKIANTYKTKLESSGEYDKPIATEIIPFVKFWEAEGYHQNYEKLNPNNPYVLGVSVPRLKKFQAKYPELLKSQHGER
ncbi:Peptide-methionine (S)-S-oxide reductase MsrA [hydrothermal vent metagenome]|uniref:peptide-methionine (S)-S-oxide reductase n=1 Tax=hydrothermal vent metagenome TaxID=652676 RepID=A0A3B0UKI7_9ZZZZ